MSSNLIGPELEKTGKITKDKNVNEEKEKRKSQKWIMLKKLEHISPT